MDRYEAQYAFWSSFGVPAYEQNSVPDLDDLTFPYITFEAAATPTPRSPMGTLRKSGE